MVVERVLGNINDYDCNNRSVDKVYLEWYEFEKKLLKKTAQSGEEIGIRLSSHLHDGDILYEDDEKVILVELLPTELMVVKVKSVQEMGRLCFELGNRHLPISIREYCVMVPYDEPTFQYLEKLGFKPGKQKNKFNDITICSAHGHSHNHDN